MGEDGSYRSLWFDPNKQGKQTPKYRPSKVKKARKRTRRSRRRNR